MKPSLPPPAWLEKPHGRVHRNAVMSSGRSRTTTCPPPTRMISVPRCGCSRHIMVVTLSMLTQTVCPLVSVHLAHVAITLSPDSRPTSAVDSQFLHTCSTLARELQIDKRH